MPSKSSANSVHKFRGFHLKYTAKKNKHAKVLSKVSNVSSQTERQDVSAQSSKTKGIVKKRKFPKFKFFRRIESKSDRNTQRKKLSKELLLNGLKRNLSFTHLSGSNSNFLDRECHSCSYTKDSCEVSIISEEHIVKPLSFKSSEGRTVPLSSNVTIQAIDYKCKLLQFHNSKCSCATPRLHVYLNTNHRCYDECSIKSFYNLSTNPASSSSSSPVNKYIFVTMTGKSRARNSRKTTKEERLKKVHKRKVGKNVPDLSSNNKREAAAKRKPEDEPESELLGEECVSLPTIMNTLSSDVEYIVLDDDTFNLSKDTNNDVTQSVPVSKVSHMIEDDVKPDIPCISGMPEITKEGRNWEHILEKCLLEVSYQPNKEKSSQQALDNTKIKIEPPEGDNAENSSLAGVCTNLCPSIKDIFGDISIKDEPLEVVDENDMTIEDFNQEIKQLTGVDKQVAGSSKWPISSTSNVSQDSLANKGLFAGLIKEEVKEVKRESSPESHDATPVHKSTSNDATEGDGYSSDDSLGPLQIDEGEQNTEDQEAAAPAVQQGTSLILPSVNIISPFKIKIFFGNPHRVELENNHATFSSTSGAGLFASEPIKAIENGVAVEKASKQILGLFESDDSLTDSLQTLMLHESNVTPSLTCIYCNTVSPDVKALAKHFEDHQKEGLIICYFCQKSFGDKTGMKRHMRSHTGEKPYQCKVCGKRFSLPGNFKKHRDIHEDIRTEPCEICGKTFRRKEHLKYHMRTHTGEKPYTCSECGTCFTARYSLQIHMNIHLGKKPYKCSYCTKAFSDKSTMRKHVRVHTGEKPFNCEKCGRCFGESGTLAAHMATHRSDRPFKCTQCPLSFKTTGGLRQHDKIHTGDKQYACKYCGVKFLQKYNMTMHERIHTGEKPYGCEHCDRSFRSRSCLAKHIVLHGGEEERRYECEHCNSKFYRKAHLKRHIDMHLGIKKHECNICSKKFCTRITLESHRKTFHAQGARRFPCNWCGRVFKRKVYVNTHECIRDPAKVEQYKQEMKAAAAANASNDNSSLDPSIEENGSETDCSSIDIKSEPEDEDAGLESSGLGEIHNVIGNANFEVKHEGMVKNEPS